MKTKILIVVFFICLTGHAQDWNSLARKDLTLLLDSFKEAKDKYNFSKEELNKLTDKLDAQQNIQFVITLKNKKDLDSLYKKRTSFVDFYKLKGVKNDSLIKFFPEEIDFQFLGADNINKNILDKKTTYLLFDNKDLINEKEVFDNSEASKVLSSVLNENSRCNLGKFEIPAVGQLIPAYTELEARTEGDSLFKYLRFTEVNITLKEGAFEDIRVTLIDSIEHEKYYFENKLPTSLLRYSKNSSYFKLVCSSISAIDNVQPYDHKNRTIENIYIYVKDVLLYFPNSGNNYVPDDQNLIFPIPNKPIQNLKTRGEYQLIQNTSLQNTVELRTYTDFLGLFNESPNGTIQVEGKATFYLNPFRLTGKTLFKQFYFLKKLTPFVHFTKIDEINRGLDLKLESVVGVDSTFSVKNSLEIIEKSYLGLGINVNIFSFKFTKEMPFKINLFCPVRYNSTAIDNKKTQKENLNVMSYGLGLNFEFNKFSNFGFNYSFEWLKYDPINRSEKILNPNDFKILRNEAEIFYYPGESKNQSIFTRLITFYNGGAEKDSFFQFQFGYRFSLGTGNVKSR